MPNVNPIVIQQGTTPTTGWQRPSDWLPIPTIATGEEVIYILMAVYDVVGNFAAFKFRGAYTVDWGDGNSENVADNVKAEHSYLWADVGDVTSEGFRQALIKITPQVGQNLTLVDLVETHTGASTLASTSFIDIVLNVPNVTNLLTIGGSTSRHYICERVFVKEIGAITSTQQLFYNFKRLQAVPLFDTSSVVSFYRMFYGCTLYTESPAFDLSAATRVDRMFELTSVEKVNTMNYSTVGNVTYHFVNLYAFTSPTTMTLTAATSLSNLFSGCIGIRSIELLDLGNITSTVSCFRACYSLVSLIVEGITVGFSVANCNMPATALDAMFTSLGTANGTQSITITGNYGAATCDQTIATAKGYTIVN